MRILAKTVLACAALYLCSATLTAQQRLNTDPAIAAPAGLSDHWPRVVTGEPYSAVTEVESVQIAADGTRFDRKVMRQKTYRDSQGRTRSEHYIGMGPSGSEPNPTLATILIRDPAAGVTYSLNPRTHTAKMLHTGRLSEATGDIETTLTSRNRPNIPPTNPTQEERERYQPKITREDLGTQEIEGLTVTGTRITMAFPAGAQGSDRPFEIVTERWASEELKTFIVIKNSDPRNGENTIRTTNIDRSEPDPSLFEVPADYAITEQ